MDQVASKIICFDSEFDLPSNHLKIVLNKKSQGNLPWLFLFKNNFKSNFYSTVAVVESTAASACT